MDVNASAASAWKQRDGAAAEAGSRHADAQARRMGAAAFHHDIQLATRYGEVVAQTGVAGVHQSAPARTASPCRMASAARSVRSFSRDDVPRASARDFVEPIGFRLESLPAITSRRAATPKTTGGGFALAAPLVVGRIDQAAPRGRVEHDHRRARRKRHRFGVQRAAVDEQRVSGPTRRGDHLIHDAAAHADPFVLGALAELRHPSPRPRAVSDTAANARATASSSAADDDSPAPTGTSPVITPSQPRSACPACLQRPRHALDVLDPAAAAAGDRSQRGRQTSCR